MGYLSGSYEYRSLKREIRQLKRRKKEIGRISTHIKEQIDKQNNFIQSLEQYRTNERTAWKLQKQQMVTAEAQAAFKAQYNDLSADQYDRIFKGNYGKLNDDGLAYDSGITPQQVSDYQSILTEYKAGIESTVANAEEMDKWNHDFMTESLTRAYQDEDDRLQTEQEQIDEMIAILEKRLEAAKQEKQEGLEAIFGSGK